jgi:hypothetical protein
MPDLELDLLCHHEAAHAAVAVHFGLRLHAVWINPEMDNGQTQVIPEPKATRLQEALILVAGAAAERIVDPTSGSRRISATMDYMKLHTLVSEQMDRRLIHRPVEYVDRLGERIDGRIIRCGRKLVLERWPAVVRLAAALKKRHRIEGAEAEAILAGMIPRPSRLGWP